VHASRRRFDRLPRCAQSVPTVRPTVSGRSAHAVAVLADFVDWPRIARICANGADHILRRLDETRVTEYTTVTFAGLFRMPARPRGGGQCSAVHRNTVR